MAISHSMLTLLHSAKNIKWKTIMYSSCYVREIYLITCNFLDILISQISRFLQNCEIKCREKNCRENLLPRKLSDIILKLNNVQLRLL